MAKAIATLIGISTLALSGCDRIAALAHKTPDAVQAAYRRTTYLGTPGQPGARVKLMEAWGRFCDGGEVATGNASPPM